MTKMHGVPMELTIAINTAQLMLTLIGNLLVCLAFCKVKSLRTPANVLLLSLAVADFLFVPVFVLNIVEESSMEMVLACRLRRTLYHTLNTVVLWNLAAIGVDRLLAIKYPLRYKQMVTKRRAGVVVVAVWLLAVAVTVFPTILQLVRKEQRSSDQEEFVDLLFGESACRKNYSFRPNNTHIPRWRRPLKSFFSGVFPLILPYIILLVAYTWISVISWRHFKRVKKQLEAVCPERKLQMKFAKTSAIVMGSFLILFSPLLLLAIMKLFQVKIKRKLILRVANLVASNSAWLNPPIYAWRNRTYREAFRKLLKPLLCLSFSERTPGQERS